MEESLTAKEAAALDLLNEVLADYERRRAHWWGRFLFWMLRRTT